MNATTLTDYKERVLLVHVNFTKGQLEEDVEEFQALALSAGADIVDVIISPRQAPTAKYFIGLGKAEEIRDQVAAARVALVLFNHSLTPAQERNLERLMQCRVLDRTGLILAIFAQRARSFEGKLQVELAQLKHISTRLIRGWTHLERQRGGIGLRGPGETQLEVDRRLIRQKIKTIAGRLAKIRMQREQGRRARRRAVMPTVALVGYTNAGKSTLFNRLTGAAVYVADQLFATLDPTLRRVDLPKAGPVILADTVGFIRHLPHGLIEAFQATLEEVSEADLLLHVVDQHNPDKSSQIEQVQQVLVSIHAETVPMLYVYNKIDLNAECLPRVEKNEFGEITHVFVSAVTGAGLDLLAEAIAERLQLDLAERELILAPHEGKKRASLYARNAVLSEVVDETGHYHLRVRLPRIELERFFR